MWFPLPIKPDSVTGADALSGRRYRDDATVLPDRLKRKFPSRAIRDRFAVAMSESWIAGRVRGDNAAIGSVVSGNWRAGR
jgi:hypothetical protein